MGVLNDAPFEILTRFVLEDEGPMSNHAWDPGGQTVYGIAREKHRDKTAFWARVDALVAAGQDPGADLELHEMARTIYRLEYYQSLALDMLPLPLQLHAFDCAVNQGVPRAARGLQRCLGLKQDGSIGPVTKAAFSRLTMSTDMGRLQETVVKFAAFRIKKYNEIKDYNPLLFAEANEGWFRRVARTTWRAALLTPRGFP